LDSNWIEFFGFFNKKNPSLYLTSVYYSITTMTTVGYGDIRGTNTSERAVCILLMVLGVIFFSMASGSVNSIVTSLGAESEKIA